MNDLAREMNVFFDGDHYVVATNPDDADKVLAESGHPDKRELAVEFLDAYDFHDWKQVEREVALGPFRSDALEISGLTVDGLISGSAKDWAKAVGRGLIASQECCSG